MTEYMLDYAKHTIKYTIIYVVYVGFSGDRIILFSCPCNCKSAENRDKCLQNNNLLQAEITIANATGFGILISVYFSHVRERWPDDFSEQLDRPATREERLARPKRAAAMI